MECIEVKDKYTVKQFLQIPRIIYKNDKNWVCPLDKDIEIIFNKNENTFYHNGDAKRWILKDKNKLIGRIAAFFNSRFFKPGEPKIGGIGFFECINNQQAANILFDTAKNWLKKQEIYNFDGPINFGEKDKFWGLMVEGFKNPSYQENYNPLYYKNLFENYGFKKITEQTTSEITYADFNYERFSKLASRVLNNPNYSFKHFEMSKINQFANDFIAIYNQAWASRPDFVPMTFERIKTTLKSLKPILMPDAIWFAYANGEPAGFYVNVIDVNQIFKHLNGKLNFWGIIKFLWYRNFGDISRVRGIVFGVIPKYQNLGLETGMIMKFHDAMLKHPKMRTTELAWIGDFNPKMHSLFNSLGAKTTKVHYTYRYSG
ncbi:MAG: GNAT family N-acetyltransferase [Bacteroidia bacterium]